MSICLIKNCGKPTAAPFLPCCSSGHYEVAMVAGLIFQRLGPDESDAAFRTRIAARFEADPDWKGV